MTDIFQGSDLNRRFIFDEVLFMDINFYQLNLTRGSSYLLLDWISRKGGVINSKNEIDEECSKGSIIAALHNAKIRSHPERISNLTRLEDNYDWSGLQFPLGISEFEKKHDVIVNVLGVEEKKVKILRGKKYDCWKKVADLLLIAEGVRRHYTAIKSLSRLLYSSNTKHERKQYFCLNCLQSFPTEFSRDKHFEYCKNNKTVRIEMPKEDSLLKFYDGQYQFKVPFSTQTLKQSSSQLKLRRSRSRLLNLIQKDHTLKLLISTFPLVSV